MAELPPPLLETRIDAFPLWRKGKVRDVYDLGDRLLVVATDRISAFDVVVPNGIPGKGIVLTQLSIFWFQMLRDLLPNHLLATEADEYDAPLLAYRSQLRGRSMIVHKTAPLPVECVVRGYLAGSGWKDYQATGGVCGISLAGGLRESERLPEPIFTPATKADSGHDENISFDDMASVVGSERASRLRELSLEIYARARDHLDARGIILADTKFEFGQHAGTLVWIDEALTPDSSRFWPLDGYQPGRGQPSFDKQFVRDHLASSGWDRRPPAPALPEAVVQKTCEKYREAYRRITGKELA
jgi:phosphoribosylaminoimidazole-succinocarboxamide synthase